MALPAFLLRKLYRRGTLRETADGRFAFVLQNPLASATLVSPPHFVINGISYRAEEVEAEVDLAGITPTSPFPFTKGIQVELSFPGRLLRGGNRIHINVATEEFGELDFLVEDREAEFCDLPGAREEE